MKKIQKLGYMVLGAVLVLILTLMTPIPASAGNSMQFPELASAGQKFTIAVNSDNGYAIKNDGTLWAWGRNPFGWAFGNGMTESSDIPVQVMSDVTSVRTNGVQTFALKTDGSVWAWGNLTASNDPEGQTGWSTAQKIMENVITISGDDGNNGVFAIKSDNSLWQWTFRGGESLWLSDVESVFISREVIFADDQLPGILSFNGIFVIRTDGTLWRVGNAQEPVRITEQTEVITAAFNDTAIDSGGNFRGLSNVAAYSRSGNLHNTLALMTDGTLWFSNPFETNFVFVQILSDVRLPGGVTEVPSAWAEAQVSAAIAEGLVPLPLQTGYTRPITRAEFAALAVALYENQRGEITGRETFDDTDDINVKKAAYLGVVTGIGGNRFDPGAGLTREQAAVMLSRLAGSLDRPFPAQSPVFGDNRNISSWAVDGVGAAQAAGIMSGVGDNRFDPQGPYTIEQSIVTIMRLFEFVTNNKAEGNSAARLPLLRYTLSADTAVGYDSYALTADGEVMAFGAGEDREVDGEWIWIEAPVVSLLSDAVAVSGVHAVTADGGLWKLSRDGSVRIMDNASGFSGLRAVMADGTLYDLSGGTPVRAEDNASETSGDFEIRADGSLYRIRGRSGHQYLPDAEAGHIMDNVAELILFNELVKIITTDGALWAFGLNGSGLFGDDPWFYQETPVHIMNNVAETRTAGWSISWTTLIYRADGSLWMIDRYVTEGELMKILDDVVAFTQYSSGQSLSVTHDGALWVGREKIMDNMMTVAP